jgi:hypothetical protein
VIKAIEEYIKKFTSEVELFVSSNADIVFSWEGKKVAIEVETGNAFERDKKSLLEKVKLLKKKYADWFFVVVDWRDKEKYTTLGKTYSRREISAILKKEYFASKEPKFASVPEGGDISSSNEVQMSPLLRDNSNGGKL